MSSFPMHLRMGVEKCDTPFPGGPVDHRQPVETCVSHIMRPIREKKWPRWPMYLYSPKCIFYTKIIEFTICLITNYPKLGLLPRFLQKYITRPHMAISSSLRPRMRPIPQVNLQYLK